MKKILLGIVTVFALYSCTDEDYDKLNHDQMNPEEVKAGFLVTGATTSYFNRMLSINVNSNIFRLVAQYWNETVYTQESNYDLDGRSISDGLWNLLMTDVIFDLNQAKNYVKNDLTIDEKTKANQNAVIEILQIQAWQVLVDTFGNIPYSEALQGTSNPNPKYDDAKTIYGDLIKRLDVSLASIDVSSPGMGENDIVYADDMSKWKKMGGSLLLKLSLQVSDVDAALAKSTAEKAIAYGVIDSSDNDFKIAYSGSLPYVNPLWIDLVQGGRTDFVAANTIVDYMNNLEDPRRPIYFRQNLGDGVYKGGIYGSASPYGTHTQPGDILHQRALPGILLNSSEVNFYLAEAVERGLITGNAADYYNQGIEDSFVQWGLTKEQAAAYIAKTNVSYATATGTWKEKIGLQSWLANYNKGFEAWTNFRRLDAPKLNVAQLTGRDVPNRYTYPARERNLNGANNSAAAAAIGGDKLDTKLFWDKF
ncbi:SusD/RagB family nutrient-binding outer membrane lipoprotein [Empedobacter falsenii]